MDQPNGLSGPAREPNDGVRFFEELLRQCGIPAENDHILIIREYRAFLSCRRLR
jgi:hypothetical protein